jgi:WD40 repeat protein
LDIPDSTFDSWVNTTAFSPDGAYMAAGSSDLDVRIWDTSTWTPVQTLPHPAALTQVAFSHDSRSIISAATDGVTRVWDMRSNLRPTMAGLVWNVSITPDGQRLAAFSGEESRIWDTADLAGPALGQMGTPDGADDPITGAGDLSPDGQHMALGGRFGAVYLMDVHDAAPPRLVGRPLGGSEAQVETVAFSPDGRLLAAGGQDTNIRVWDISEPERPRRVAVIDEPTEMLLYLAWSPDGDQLAAASADNDVYLYDMGDERSPQLLTRLGGFDSEAYTAAFSPDGQILATAGSDTTVILWNISTPTAPQQIGEPITGPVARVYDLSFDKQGNRLAAAVIDGTTWVWDTRDLRSPERIAVLGPADGAMYTTLFTPDGDALVGSGGDGQIRVWDMDVEAVIRHVCATAGDPITKKEWHVYLRTTPYTPPCP